MPVLPKGKGTRPRCTSASTPTSEVVRSRLASVAQSHNAQPHLCVFPRVADQAAPATGQPDGRRGDEVSAKANDAKGEIVLTSELLKEGAGMSGPWLAHGASKIRAIEERGATNPNAGVNDFDTEHAARTALGRRSPLAHTPAHTACSLANTSTSGARNRNTRGWRALPRATLNPNVRESSSGRLPLHPFGPRG
jgi:hypothetical protein